MNESGQWKKLLKAVSMPHSGLSAVELRTDDDAHAIAERIGGYIAPRPHAKVEFNCALHHAASIVAEVRECAKDWPESQGVVCVCDKSPQREDRSIRFWREINFKREIVAYVKAHVVLLLKPFNYELFLSEADDLADFTPVRILLEVPEVLNPHAKLPAVRIAPHDPNAAEHFRDLDLALDVALKKNGSAPELTGRYYLPML